MDYNERMAKGNKAAATLERYFQSRSLQWHRLALERLVPPEATYAIADAMGIMENNGIKDGARLLDYYRYLPDYYVDGRGFVDAKSSVLVERHCYEHYLKIQVRQDESVTIAQVIDENTINMIKAHQIVFVYKDWQTSANGSGKPFNSIDLEKTPHTTVRISEL